MSPYLEYDDYLCKRKQNKLKHYISLKKFNPETRKEIIETLNNHSQDISILKKPSNKRLTFLINDKPYIEHWWVNEYHDFVVNLYVLPKEQQLVLPPVVKEHHYLNIFNEGEVVEPIPEEYYVIKCDNKGGVFMVDKSNHMVSNTQYVFENFSIFEGKHIVIDIDSFIGGGFVKDNGLIDLNEVRKVITSKYRVSYINKILNKKNLLSHDMRNYIEKCHCVVHSVWADQEHKSFMVFVVDNFGDKYELKVEFDDENHNSNFRVVRKV